MGRHDRVTASPILVSSREYFTEVVSDAFDRRRVKTLPLAKSYLVELLEFHVPAANLFDESDSSGRKTRATLAETFFKAQNSEPKVRIELLKKLADRSLYIAGFFGDSLQRKLVDVDYYADMGSTAYGSLASCVREDAMVRLYKELAERFLQFVDVLTDISSQAHVLNEENIMRLYETYARTGSDVAREKLMEKGLIPFPASEVSIKKRQ